jgi:hypothetical protein
MISSLQIEFLHKLVGLGAQIHEFEKVSNLRRIADGSKDALLILIPQECVILRPL